MYDHDPQLRGKFDNIIINSKKFQELMESDEYGVEAMKIGLSDELDAYLYLSDVFGGEEEGEEEEKLTVSRDEFEKKIHDLITKSVEIVKNCLNEVGVKLTSDDAILLVGGSSNIPCIRSSLEEAFRGVTLSNGVDVNTVVAEGAYRYACQKAGIKDGLNDADVLVRQFAPYSVYYSFGTEKTLIIEKNSTSNRIYYPIVEVPDNPIMSLYQEMTDERTGKRYYLHFGQIDLSEYRGQSKKIRVSTNEFGELEFKLEETGEGLPIRYDCAMSEDEKKNAQRVIQLLNKLETVKKLRDNFEKEYGDNGDNGKLCDELGIQVNDIEKGICSLIGKNKTYEELENEFSSIEVDLRNVENAIMEHSN